MTSAHTTWLKDIKSFILPFYHTYNLFISVCSIFPQLAISDYSNYSNTGANNAAVATAAAAVAAVVAPAVALRTNYHAATAAADSGASGRLDSRRIHHLGDHHRNRVGRP